MLHSFLNAGEWISVPLDLTPCNYNQTENKKKGTQCKWGLALSGGGARGLAQIGAIKVLEENGIQIHGIAGTSIGAIIGGLYSAGFTAAELESLAYAIQWDEIMQNSPPRKQLFLAQKADKDKYLIQLRFKGLSLDFPSAFSSGQRLNSMITEHVLNTPNPFPENFDKLPIPFRAISTDLVSGQKVILNSGSLIDAMRASMAIPLLFNPVEKEGALLVDGGLVQNLPVDETRALNVDLVLAIDTSSKLRPAEELNAAWEIADQATTIMQREQTIAQYESADIQVQPSLDGISNTDFQNIEEIIKAGEEAAKNQLKKIQTLDSLYAQKKKNCVYTINTFSWHDSTQVLPDSVVENFTSKLPQKISEDQIRQLCQRWMQTSRFRTIQALIDTSLQCLQFHFEEYPQIKTIMFSGNTIFSDSLISHLLIPNDVDVITQPIIESRLKRLIRLYQSQGFSLCNIDTLINHGDSLQIIIDEGRISNVRIEGKQRTRSLVILREMKTQKGSLFQSDQVKKDIQNIYSTGLFEAIGFNVNKKNNDHQLKIQVIEQGSFLLRSGLRYDNSRQMKGYVQFVEDNFWGTGNKVSFLGLTGGKDDKLELCLRSDRFFKTMFTYKVCASYQKSYWKYYQNYESLGKYAQSTSHFSFTLGQQMQRLGTFSATIQSENIDIGAENNTDIPVGSYLIRNISIQSEVDTRDQRYFPNSGKYNLIYYETGGPLFGSEIAYMRIYSTMESYHPIFKRLNFHPKVAWGNADNGTPFPKKFTLGGYTSFAGLRRRQLFGKRFLLLSGELRYQLPWPHWTEFYISGRYDFAGIWEKYEKINMQDFFHGLGAAFSFKTPLGPVRFAYGEESNGHSRFYISAGYSF